ncbi:C6 finger domain-containing protein [Colletotrichum musicola]|uniref:C6 finger domain-containing protein n=1 Tax=Colletotrichum musicola TaxID=2175873 RepID=A0A8H6U7X5_9PEZI|nr:C6 finger domain-containing protein [Colletotrichum musicola]
MDHNFKAESSSSAAPATPAAPDSSSTPTESAYMKRDRHIALRACDACRSRKQKCDEQKPKCGWCKRTGYKCEYQPIKETIKDKNGADTLAAVNRIEPKVHETHDKVLESHQYIELIYEKVNSLPAFLASAGGSHEMSMGAAQQTPGQPRPTALQKGQHQYVSAVHKMMVWRVVRQTLEAVHPKIINLETVFTDEPYPSAMLEQQGLMHSLPHVGVDAHSPSRLPTAFVMGQIPQGWPWNKQYLESRSAVYFDSFNLIHPVLDHKLFVEVTLPSALYDSMQDSAESTLVLLVMALAEMALAEGSDFSISQSNYRVALEGTAVNVPPGLDFFNEARRRMGFSMADCTLENVQIFVLAGLYYECCSRHKEFWTMTVQASLACHALINSEPAALDTSPRGDLIRRAFWHCCAIESGLNLEFGMPFSVLERWDETISFENLFIHRIHRDSHVFDDHFYTHISLRGHALDFHRRLTAIAGPASASGPFSPGKAVLPDRLLNEVHAMDSELFRWRQSLPVTVRWTDGAQVTGYPSPEQHSFSNAPYPAPGEVVMEGVQQAAGSMFYTSPPGIMAQDMTGVMLQGPSLIDRTRGVLDALLRTRYCYLRFLIYRPFIYRVLHYERITEQDQASAAECLRACLLWPIISHPACRNKRLITCRFFWSHNLLGILIILYLSTKNDRLKAVRSSLGEDFEHDAETTVSLCIKWIKDLKKVDASAEWCWSIARALYPLHDDERVITDTGHF